MKPACQKRHPPAGARPGTLIIPPDSPHPVINILEFAPETLDERTIVNADELKSIRESDHCFRVDIQGLGNETLLRQVAEIFSLHPLTPEDLANVPTRPRTEVHDTHQPFVARMVRVSDDGIDLIVEQGSLNRFVSSGAPVSC